MEALCDRIEKQLEWEKVSVAVAAAELGIDVPDSTYRAWKKRGADLVGFDPGALSELERACLELAQRVERAEMLAAHNWNKAVQEALKSENKNAGRMLDFGKLRFRHVRSGDTVMAAPMVIVREAPAKTTEGTEA